MPSRIEVFCVRLFEYKSIGVSMSVGLFECKSSEEIQTRPSFKVDSVIRLNPFETCRCAKRWMFWGAHLWSALPWYLSTKLTLTHRCRPNASNNPSLMPARYHPAPSPKFPCKRNVQLYYIVVQLNDIFSHLPVIQFIRIVSFFRG